RDRGAGRARTATDAAREAVLAAPAVLVSDYGRGTADALRDVLTARPPLVWDPHPRGGPPVPGTRLVTPAEKEALALAPDAGPGRRDLHAAAHGAAARTALEGRRRRRHPRRPRRTPLLRRPPAPRPGRRRAPRRHLRRRGPVRRDGRR